MPALLGLDDREQGRRRPRALAWAEIRSVAAHGGLEIVSRAIIAGLVLIILLLAAWPVLLWLRRRALVRQYGRGPAGFSMEDLEELRRTGRISDEEFGRIRRSLLGLPAEKDDAEGSSSCPPSGDDDTQGRQGQQDSSEETQ